MKIDMHFHVVGNGRDLNNADNDIYFNPDVNQHWFTGMTDIVYKTIEKDLKKKGADLDRDGEITTGEYFELVYKTLISSREIDGIVLLAFDATYFFKSGELNKDGTNLYITNKFLSNKVIELNERLQNETNPKKRNKKFFFGASVNPNRKDWESELDYVLTKTNAVLIKWIPSAQHIQVNDEGHKEFYNILSSQNMPLLCHVGPEYSFPEGIRQKKLDNFKFLETPLKYGVKTIAAHCASPVFPVVDKNNTREFYAFMKNANSDGKIKLWADTSALSMSSRLPIMPELVKTFPSEWLVHGSDFPVPIVGWHHFPYITYDINLKEYTKIIKAKNPLDEDVVIKRAHGFSNTILENAEKVLRLNYIEQ